MLGIGHRLQKQTKIKILAQKARQYNYKYDNLLQHGTQPQQAMKTLTKQQFNHRHQGQNYIDQPYKISNKINTLPGAVNLGYTQTHKVKSTTKAMMQPMETQFQLSKSGGNTGFGLTKTPQQIHQLKKLKQRIKKDHLQQDAQINLNEQKISDYKKNFVHDEKMKHICQNKDMKFNQRKNDLKQYAETYIKTKNSLRK